jgi:hypothetical protein
MKIATLLALGALSSTAWAGCIGPVIMGECQGSSVPWDTHPAGVPASPQPPAGFYWDHRPELAAPAAENPWQWMNRQQSVNPFTGRDAHDPQGFLGDEVRPNPAWK